MTDRVIRFAGASYQEIEALPGPRREAAQRALFQLLEDPVPSLADPFPEEDPVKGAYKLHLPAADATFWYTVTPHKGTTYITLQQVMRGRW